MYTINGGAIVEVRVLGKIEQQDVINVLHWRYDPSGATIADGGAELGLLFNALAAANKFLQRLAQATSTDYTPARVAMQWIHPTRYVSRFFDNPYPAGTIAGGCMPSNVAMAITKRGEIADRHSIGTLHIGGIPRVNVVGSFVNGAQMLLMEDVASESISNLTVAGTRTYSPVIYDKAAPAGSVTPRTQGVQPELRTMHRRTVGLGS